MQKELPVRTDAEPSACGQGAPDHDRGNALPVLNEIRHALERLIRTGEPTTIDLRSLPMGPADEAAIAAALGPGEVEARIRALGESLVRETGVAGVWMVEHFDGEGAPAARFVEVTRIPEILRSHPDDLSDGLQQLTERLAAAG